MSVHDLNQFISAPVANKNEIKIVKSFKISKYLDQQLNLRVAEEKILYDRDVTHAEVLNKLIKKYIDREISI